MKQLGLKTFLLGVVTLFVLNGCNDKPTESKAKSESKCGAGKCGSNMFDGNAALAKKKKNILSQMEDDDPRKDCVIKAETTKKVYDCVREPEGYKLTKKFATAKCGNDTDMVEDKSMKCGADKCGSSE